MKLYSVSKVLHSKRQYGSLAIAMVCLLFLFGCATPSERLYKAASKGDAKSGARILQKGFSPKDAGAHLVKAAGEGHTEFVRFLLDAGTAVDSGLPTALMVAARYGRLETVRLLLERGADSNRQEDARKISDLRLVSQDGKQTGEFREEVLKGQGNNALSLAIKNKHRAIVEHLLKRGADPDRRIIYANPEVHSGLNYESLLGGGVRTVRVQYGPGAITEVSTDDAGNRQVRTTCTFDREKTASMKELAEMSGDPGIIALLSAASGAQPLPVRPEESK